MGYSIDPRCPLVLLVGRMDYWRWRLSLLVLLVGPYGLFESQATTPSQVFTTHHIDTDHEAAQEAAVRAVGEQLADVREARRCRPSVLALDDGRRQFICPFHAGKLWCNEVEPSPKLRDGAEFVELPAGTTKCCNGTFMAPLSELARIGHQEPAYFSPEHVTVYSNRIPVEGRFGTDQQKGAYAPRSCRAPRLEPHALASLIFDAIGNLQLTINAEIKELYELIDNYNTPADSKPADGEPADRTSAAGESAHSESADGEPADHTSAAGESAHSEPADHEQMGSADPLNAGIEPRHETTIDNSPDRDHRAPTPPRAPP